MVQDSSWRAHLQMSEVLLKPAKDLEATRAANCRKTLSLKTEATKAERT